MCKFILPLLFLLANILFAQPFVLSVAPLKIGNQWNYTDHWNGYESKFHYTVIDSGILINNISYYKVQPVFSIYSPVNYVYLRFDSTDLFYKEYWHEPNIPPPNGWLKSGIYFYYKKDAEEGFMWKDELDITFDSRYPYYYHYVKDFYRGIVFGKEVLIKYIETTDSALYHTGQWWTEEFGLIQYFDEGMNAFLAGCVIDGVVYGDTTTVGVTQKDEIIPKAFSLLQNFPNPFNPGTTITYSIPVNTFVEVKVFNILGSEIATLLNKEHTAGIYKIRFDGSNLPSGLYIYQIKAGDFSSSKKMLLVK